MSRAIVVEKDHPTEIREVDHAFLSSARDASDTPGDITVDVEWSSLNYKDGLAMTGSPGVARISPLVPGIDLVGTVVSVDGSAPSRFAMGDRVLVNGSGIGETRHGGLAERAMVDPASVVALPDGLSTRRAAAIGTAGFTAMLSVLRVQREVTPGEGDILVTGASGGVGSVAITLLSKLGYRVVASSGRASSQTEYLIGLGASEVIDRAELVGAGKAMQRARWAGAIDSVGSHTLANVLAQTRWGGIVTACGLAQGSDLPTTVLPFILRGVTLAGINSVDAPLDVRENAWSRLADDLDLDLLDSLTAQVTLAGAIDLAPNILAGHVRGRTVVDVRS